MSVCVRFPPGRDGTVCQVEERDGLLTKIRLAVDQASQSYYRLLMVVSSDKITNGLYIEENLGIKRISVGEELGEELLEIPARSRPLKVANLLERLLEGVEGEMVLLDHIEILFDESLKVEPLTLLKSVSRRRLIIVMWSGEIEAGNLVYGFPRHPEYRSDPAQDVTLVQFP